jgi:hypothetical protein
MSLTGRINEWSSIILKWVAILFMAGVIFWGAVSIYANVTEGGNSPKAPAAAEARYGVFLKATGEVLFTNNYDQFISDGCVLYILHGYWELGRSGYDWHDTDLSLNTRYFGDITIEGRTP